MTRPHGLSFVSSDRFRSAVAAGASDLPAVADHLGLQGREIAVRTEFIPDEIKAAEDGGRSVSIIISTENADRDRDVIAADGWDFRAWKKNPVVLFAHDYYSLPIARGRDIQVDGKKVNATADFVPADIYPFAETVFQMLRLGFLSAASVGFKPKEWTYNEERRGVDYKQQELLEFSIVPVPANAECLVEARAAGIDVEPLRAWAEKTLAALGGEREVKIGNLGSVIVPVEFAFRTSQTGSANATSGYVQAGDELTPKGTSPPSPSGYGMAEEATAWKAPRLADFTAQSWDDLSDAQKRKIARHYAWTPAMPPEAFADMKLPHHRPDGDVVWRGVASAMSVLMGGRGGVEMPDEDRMKVHRHLSAHYREFDKDPPEMRAYSPEDLATLEPGPIAEVEAVPLIEAPSHETAIAVRSSVEGLDLDAALAMLDDLDLDALDFERTDDDFDLDAIARMIRDTIATDAAAGVRSAFARALGRVD